MITGTRTRALAELTRLGQPHTTLGLRDALPLESNNVALAEAAAMDAQLCRWTDEPWQIHRETLDSLQITVTMGDLRKAYFEAGCRSRVLADIVDVPALVRLYDMVADES